VARSSNSSRPYPYAGALRQELSVRNRDYARAHNLAHRESYGELPVVCYLPTKDGSSHGNFLSETYRAIRRNQQWRRRLEKVHTQAQATLPHEDWRWRELDSSNSSDALLMNIFCFPPTLRQKRVFDLLGVEFPQAPQFGVRARVPMANGRADRTEIDMRLGDLLVEAKLTEFDFQSADPALLEAYRDFAEVFDRRLLPREGKRFASYQLIRNVLAAHATQCSFCVMADARRPDLTAAWYAVLRAVQRIDLRLRCKMITWQELVSVLPSKLQLFLAEKYGIMAAGSAAEESSRSPEAVSA